MVEAKELWQIVLHRKWMLLISGTLLSALAVVLALMLMPRNYMASITVLVDPQKVPTISEIVTMSQISFDNLSQQVLSPTRLQEIADELHLCDDVKTCPSKQNFAESMRSALALRLRTGGTHNTSSFTISYTGTSPKIAAEVVTRLAKSFIDWDLEARARQAEQSGEFLSAEQQQAKQALDEREAALVQFRVQHARDLPGLSHYVSGLSDLQERMQASTTALDRLQQEKAGLTQGTDASRAQAGIAATERARLEAEVHKVEDQLVSLRTRYSDEYPDVVQANSRLDALHEQLSHLPAGPAAGAPGTAGGAQLDAVNRDIERLQENRNRIQSEISGYQSREDLPLVQVQLADLTRDYSDAKSHYMSYFDKNVWAKTATDLQRKQEPGRFSILDPAQIPDTPLKNKKMLLIPLVVPFCFLFCAAIIVLYERFIKGTIATETSLRSLLPSPVTVLGRIPVIDTPGALRYQRQVAALTSVGVLIIGLASALFLRKVSPIAVAATSSIACVAAAIFLKSSSRKAVER
jgi:uncharacterized protein involved in exopolysaccharide biosynthesis